MEEKKSYSKKKKRKAPQAASHLFGELKQAIAEKKAKIASIVVKDD